jgi:2-polyprenyl-3-methyl-5-hydroxy-6-metoxy-1,4-benzoquinol methylase
VFVGNRIEPDELGCAYATVDHATYYSETAAESTKKMQSCVEDLTRLIGRDDRILDIGTGDGRFLDMLLRAGFTRVAGHEIPDSTGFPSLTHAGCRIYRDFDYSTVPSASADVVTLLDVAEHVADPRLLFDTCRRILAEGGLVYLHTPVVTRVDRLMHVLQSIPMAGSVGRAWQRGRTSVFHLQNYSRAALTTVLHDAGFEEIEIAIRNELSWPVTRYVRVYLCEKQGWPVFLAPLLTPVFYPLLATNALNANKAIAWGRKRTRGG